MKCKRFFNIFTSSTKNHSPSGGNGKGAVVLLALFALFFASCSSSQKITVRQEQEGQIQETVIESDTKFNALSLYFGDKDTQIGELGVNHYKL